MIGLQIQQMIIFQSKRAAQQLSFLRQNRKMWRHRLQLSPLGDPMGLMNALESAFSEMALRHAAAG